MSLRPVPRDPDVPPYLYPPRLAPADEQEFERLLDVQQRWRWCLRASIIVWLLMLVAAVVAFAYPPSGTVGFMVALAVCGLANLAFGGLCMRRSRVLMERSGRMLWGPQFTMQDFDREPWRYR